MAANDLNKGKLILIIGDTGTGKSTFAENVFIKGTQPVLIYDVNNEYPNIKLDNTGKSKQCKVNSLDCDISDFIEFSKFRKNTNILFEEATGFFRFRANGEMMKRLISKRHGNNNYIFIFHSIKQVPKDLFELSNYIVLFKTKDIEKDIESKRPELLPYFRTLKASKNKYLKTIITI